MKKFFIPEPVIITTGSGGPGLFHDTIPNMKKAISLGSDVIRTNVSCTRDKKIILYSNAVFQNKTIAKKGVTSFTLNELNAMFDTPLDRSGNGIEEDFTSLFPELESVLSEFKDHRFNFHFSEKDPELIQKFCDSIRDLHSEERILVSSLDGYNIKIIRNVFPDVATGFSFNGMVGFYALYRTGLIYFKKYFRNDALITHEMIGASFLANAGLIEEAKSRGIRVYVLNVMKEDQVKRLSEAGVNGFVTNYAALVKRALPDPGENY